MSDVLSNRGMEGLVDVAALLTSEVVTDVLRHAGSDIALDVIVRPSSVRIELAQAWSRRPVRSRNGPDGSVPDRGPELVESLAERWGVRTEAGGKSVWFELRRRRRNSR